MTTVFQRLHDAGLTLRGRKCRIGMTSVTYLGHVFSANGMSPDPTKVQAVQAWPVPTDVKGLRQFLGLSSYYRRYIQDFSKIAAPLHALTQNNARFNWDDACQAAFLSLKQKLIQPPVLTYPQFHTSASPFAVYTDASNVGLGAVLEQDHHVIAYASRTLSKSEQNYSIIQKECLAIVYATKQFRHYLLGRQFTLHTDHAPLQWLSGQRMEGLLARWALALQEYQFQIVYRKGTLHGNADSLSRRGEVDDSLQAAATMIQTGMSLQTLQVAQLADPVLLDIYRHLFQGKKPMAKRWKCPSLCRYRQLWPQLKVVDGVVCRKYCPGPLQESITVPVLPRSLQHDALVQAHDTPAAGDQGQEKTLHNCAMMAIGQAWSVMSINIANNVSLASSQSYLHQPEHHLFLFQLVSRGK